MTKLYVVSRPIVGDVGDLLRVAGVDKRTIVVVLDPGLGGGTCHKQHVCVDTSAGLDMVAKNVIDIVKSKGVSYIRFVLGEADALTSTAIHTLYMVFSTIEVFSGIEVELLNLIHGDELIRLDFKPRLWLDLRDLKILSSLGRCRTSGDLAKELGIPGSSARRRLSNMARKGMLNTTYIGKTRVYCPTTLARIFSYTLTQILL